MSDEIAPVLAELRNDHRNMAVLLDLLERESEKVFAGEEADYDLVRDVMQYMTTYPDAVHHPNEDRVYAELRAARPDLAGGMSRISLEHSQITEHGILLRDKIEQVIAGDMVLRSDVVARISRYAEYLRKHIRWEECDLFRRIDRMIADGHTVLKTSVIIRGHDPVFSAPDPGHFDSLLENLRIAQ